MRSKAALYGVALLLAAGGCSREAQQAATAPPASSPAPAPTRGKILDPDGNVTLYVSNQSFAVTPVDIRVEIDGERVVSQDFHVGNQHSQVKFTLRLGPGEHELRASSQKGAADLVQKFKVTGKHWSVLDYWYYPPGTKGASPTPKHFSFTVSDRPVLFE